MSPKTKNKRNCRNHKGEGPRSKGQNQNDQRHPLLIIRLHRNEINQEDGEASLPQTVKMWLLGTKIRLKHMFLIQLFNQVQALTLKIIQIAFIHYCLAINVSNSLKSKLMSSSYIDIILLLGKTSLTESSEKRIFLMIKGRWSQERQLGPS